MKSIIFKIAKFLFYCFLFLIIAIFLFYQYLISDWNQAYNVERFEELKEEIRNAEELPELFYITMDKFYDIGTTQEYLLSGFINSRNLKDCPCKDNSWQIYEFEHRVYGHPYFLAIKLNKEFTSRQCMTRFAHQIRFRSKVNGVEEAARFYFKKDITEISKNEMAVLVLMYENPYYYNPLRRPELVEKKLKEHGYESDLSKILRSPKPNEIKSN